MVSLESHKQDKIQDGLFQRIRIRHTLREENGPADYIAQLEKLGDFCMHFNVPPSPEDLLHLVEENARGTIYYLLMNIRQGTT